MKKQIIMNLACLSIIVLFLAGCACPRIGPETSSPGPVVKELVKTSNSWDGARLPPYPEGMPEVTVLRIVIPAGERLEKHIHPVINAGVLISGQLTVFTEDGKTLRLLPGDPIVEVVNTLHYGVNDGNIPAEIIVFYAGTAGTPITVME